MPRKIIGLPEFAEFEPSPSHLQEKKGRGAEQAAPQERAQQMWDLFQDLKKSWLLFLRAHNVERTLNDRASFHALFDEDNPIAKQFRASSTFKNLQPRLHALYSDPEARLAWEDGMREHASQWENVNGNWTEYRSIERRCKTLEGIYDEFQKEKFSERVKPARERRRTLQDDLAEVELELAVVRAEQDVLRQKSPELAAKILASELEARRRELQNKDGFMWFPSRRAILEAIEARVADKDTLRLIVLEGQAGTGKTSFSRALARKFIGKNPVEVTVKAKTKMDRQLFADETLDSAHPVIYRPILFALTGKRRPEDAPEHTGQVAFADELNKGDNDEVGDLATTLDGMKAGGATRYHGMGANPEDRVQPNALVLAAQNPAGARFLNRTRFTPEVQRKLDIFQLDYFPQTHDNPELYEAFLVSLMDQDGRIQAQKTELGPAWTTQSIKNSSGQEIGTQDALVTDMKQGGMLWRVSEMLHQSYENLAERKNALTDANPDAKIQGRVLPPGDIMAWLALYRKEIKKGMSLEHFISQKFYDWIESSFTAAHDQEDKRLYLELAEKYGVEQKVGNEYRPLSAKKITLDILTQRDVAELSPRVPRPMIPKEVESRPSEYTRAIKDWTAPDGTIHRRLQFRYDPSTARRGQFRNKKTSQIFKVLGTIKECGDIPELVGELYIQEVKEAAFLESSTRFVISDSLNPYRQALIEGGIDAKDLVAAERQDIEFNLVKLINEDSNSYETSGSVNWALDIRKVLSDIRLTPEKRSIIEQEIKAGSIPILMPGKATQRDTTPEQLTNHFHPVWIKDSQPQTLNDAFLWDHTKSLIDSKANELVEGVPERPYIQFVKPTQAPEPRTASKTVDQQKQEFTKINQERKKAGQAPSNVINPFEYVAFQTRFTQRIQSQATAPLSALNPPDSFTWSRFINLPHSVGLVPEAYFNPGDRRLRFVGSGAVDADSVSGFRLSVRVEI